MGTIGLGFLRSILYRNATVGHILAAIDGDLGMRSKKYGFGAFFALGNALCQLAQLVCKGSVQVSLCVGILMSWQYSMEVPVRGSVIAFAKWWIIETSLEAPSFCA